MKKLFTKKNIFVFTFILINIFLLLLVFYISNKNYKNFLEARTNLLDYIDENPIIPTEKYYNLKKIDEKSFLEWKYNQQLVIIVYFIILNIIIYIFKNIFYKFKEDKKTKKSFMIDTIKFSLIVLLLITILIIYIYYPKEKVVEYNYIIYIVLTLVMGLPPILRLLKDS